MELQKKLKDAPSAELQKPNYMLMSLQRVLVIFVILIGVIVVVYYTPMPGKNGFIFNTILSEFLCLPAPQPFLYCSIMFVLLRNSAILLCYLKDKKVETYFF